MLLRTLTAIMFCALCGPFAFAGPDESPAAPAHGRFHNNYPEPPPQSFWLWKWEQWREGVPKPPPGGWNLPHRRADVAALRANESGPTVTWIGHSSFLVQLAGANVLFDPQFSERASPVPFAGPKRAVPLPLAIEELPRIDVVAISHNHYDHLDLATVRALARQPTGSPLFLVPLGLADWFRERGIDRVEELGWWQSRGAGALTFTLVPVQHWSKRTLWDANETLWGGWVLEGGGLRVIHAGDLGYSKDTRDIGERLGPFDLALIPIGAYAPRWFMKAHHVDVPEAIQVRRDLRAARAIGMHWGTFADLTDEPLDEPPRVLEAQRREAGLAKDEFDVLQVGETRPIEARPTGGEKP
jgi:N-acyl-phosphatidylethanolamine-hydrolysing phospholipase D